MNIKVIGKLTGEEVEECVRYACSKYPNEVVKSIIIRADGEYCDMDITLEEPEFQRIRRITGYLVGTLDRFNNAKRAEVEDRVKHDT